VVRDIDDDKNARKNAILLSNDNSGINFLLFGYAFLNNNQKNLGNYP
jgi:hypothetical protein